MNMSMKLNVRKDYCCDNGMTQQKPHNPLWNVKNFVKFKSHLLFSSSSVSLNFIACVSLSFQSRMVLIAMRRLKKKIKTRQTLNQNVINGMRLRKARGRKQAHKSFNSFHLV